MVSTHTALLSTSKFSYLVLVSSFSFEGPSVSLSLSITMRLSLTSSAMRGASSAAAALPRSSGSVSFNSTNVVALVDRRCSPCRRRRCGVADAASSLLSRRRLRAPSAPRAAAKDSSSQSTSPSAITSTAPPPKSAEEAINRGLAEFHENKNPSAALALFDLALSSPSAFPAPLTEDEARAATYNRACALAALSRWEEAAAGVLSAVNDKGLKLDVAAKDPDLRRLRERREWIDLLEQAKGGVTTGAVVRARAEAKSPFRGLRLFLFGGLGAGAGLGLLIIVARVTQALRGGEGAPDLNDSLRNLAINAAAVAAFSFLFARDFKGSARDRAAAEAEESLSKLELSLRDGRVVPLATFRGRARPVLVSGPRAAVAKALKAAAPFREELLERGVRFIGVETDAADPDGEKSFFHSLSSSFFLFPRASRKKEKIKKKKYLIFFFLSLSS